MSRCGRTAALVEAELDGGRLTDAQSSHASQCPECARALAHARRFGRELHRAVLDLTPEAAPHGVVTMSDGIGAEPVGWPRLALALAASAVVVIGVVFVGGRWLGSALGDPMDGRSEVRGPAAEAARNAEMDARRAAEGRARLAAQMRTVREIEPWFQAAVAVAFESISREEVEFIQVDLCEEIAVVTFASRADPEVVYWLAGPLHDPTVAAGGRGDWRSTPTDAAAQAAQAPPCVTAPGSNQASLIIEAVSSGAGIPGEIAPVGMARITPDLAIVAVSSVPAIPGADIEDLRRWIGVVRRADGRWVADPAEWIGANIPADEGLTPYRLEWLLPGLEGWFIVATVPREATAIELVIDGAMYRYPVVPDTGGSVIIPPEEFDGRNAHFRVLSADGSVLDAGGIRD